jgi:hypothetical protein
MHRQITDQTTHVVLVSHIRVHNETLRGKVYYLPPATSTIRSGAHNIINSVETSDISGRTRVIHFGVLRLMSLSLISAPE